MNRRPLVLLPVVAVLLAGLAACSQDSPSGSAAVAVTANDDACTLSTTSVPAGTTRFEVANQGGTVTEVYVYKGTDVVGERENIGPETNATLTVDLAAGTYEVACKPGQTGDGIRTTLTVTGAGGPTGTTTPTPDDDETATPSRPA